jgi:predicted TIM-barrel fold metal-dependent hydrolase
MDWQRIATAVTSISAPGAYFRDLGLARDLARQCNEFSAELVRAHPHRFGGFAILALPDVDAALAELRHALDILHLDGVVLMTSVAGRYLADTAFEPLLAELDHRAVPTFVHPTTPTNQEQPGRRRRLTVPYPFDSLVLKALRSRSEPLPVSMVDWPCETTRVVAGFLLTSALQRFPHIHLILSHAGGAVPYLAWRLVMFRERQDVPLRDLAVHSYGMLTHRFTRSPVEEVARGLRLLQQLYFDVAFSATPFVFPSLLALIQPWHVLFGTNLGAAAEYVGAETIRGIAEEPTLSGDARRLIERDSALTLFPRLNVE